jgi:hypothetical protein
MKGHLLPEINLDKRARRVFDTFVKGVEKKDRSLLQTSLESRTQLYNQLRVQMNFRELHGLDTGEDMI